MSLYNPSYAAFGDVIQDGQSCAGIWFDTTPPKYEPDPYTAPTFFVFTGESGPQDVPPSETVTGEVPFAPGQIVGIPFGVASGPDLILYACGFAADEAKFKSAHVARYALTSADGIVRHVRLVGYAQMAHYGAQGAAQAGWLAGNGCGVAFLIPARPLAPGTAYRGSVTWTGPISGATATQTFSFRTSR
jgi:hypothetical protein